MFQVSRGAHILLRVLAVTENQETRWLLDEMQRQPSVFVLRGPATATTNFATASAFLADGWSIVSVSRVVRTSRTRQENNERDRAEHAFYSHIHDEVTISDSFTVTEQGLEEDENLPEDTTAQDDQEDETEQSLSDSLQTRRQISRIHENREHPSNRTLLQVLRLVGAKRRFILTAAKHSCGVCEAQKRPASPIVSRSSDSFVFNDVVRLDVFFLKHVRKADAACHENRVLVHWSATCHSPAGSVGRNLEERIHKTIGCGHTEGPASLWSTSNVARALSIVADLRLEHDC